VYEVPTETSHTSNVSYYTVNTSLPWMQRLAEHIRAAEKQYPDDILLVIVDFDVQLRMTRLHIETVFLVLRWFQIRKSVELGLISLTSNASHSSLLQNIRKYAENSGFVTDEALHLVTSEDLSENKSSPEDVVTHFRQQGMQVIAYLSGEKFTPGSDDILNLNLNEIFAPTDVNPGQVVPDSSLTHLITESELPTEVALCWHGINNHDNLRQFLESDVLWGEVDVRNNPNTDKLITRHDSFKRSPKFPGEKVLELSEALDRFREHSRTVKIDFKQGGEVVERVIEMLRERGFTDSELWFHADAWVIGVSGFRKITRAFPNAIMQTTIDRLAFWIAAVPLIGKWMIRTLSNWGMNRFLLTWESRYKVKVLQRMERWGYPVNFYQIPDLEEFLKAVLLMPASITTDFNFPQWDYYGRGSGQDLEWHEYPE